MLTFSSPENDVFNASIENQIIRMKSVSKIPQYKHHFSTFRMIHKRMRFLTKMYLFRREKTMFIDVYHRVSQVPAFIGI